MSPQRDGAALVGRILLAAIFLWSGYGKLTGFASAAGAIASKGLPLPEVLAAGAIAVELGGGLLLLAGWQARWAALAIFLFLIPTTLLFHNFWAAPPEAVAGQKIHFFKNVAIMGGMLIVWAFGPGRFAVGREEHASAVPARA
ncbi:MAG: DoxX family protein [Burkholderiales bacterium]